MWDILVNGEGCRGCRDLQKSDPVAWIKPIFCSGQSICQGRTLIYITNMRSLSLLIMEIDSCAFPAPPPLATSTYYFLFLAILLQNNMYVHSCLKWYKVAIIITSLPASLLPCFSSDSSLSYFLFYVSVPFSLSLPGEHVHICWLRDFAHTRHACRNQRTSSISLHLMWNRLSFHEGLHLPG